MNVYVLNKNWLITHHIYTYALYLHHLYFFLLYLLLFIVYIIFFTLFINSFIFVVSFFLLFVDECVVLPLLPHNLLLPQVSGWWPGKKLYNTRDQSIRIMRTINVLVPVMLTLNIFCSLLWCLYCLLWTGKLLGKLFLVHNQKVRFIEAAILRCFSSALLHVSTLLI